MTTVHDVSECYIEKNVYELCDKLIKDRSAQENELFVVFISNDQKRIPMWHHKGDDKGMVLLPFHGFVLQLKTEPREYLVWDFDSALPMPKNLSDYLSECIKVDEHELLDEFERICRVVHAPIFRKHFTSDRTHMQISTSTAPSYAIIAAKDETIIPFIEESSIQKVLTEQLGVLVHAKKLVCFFSLISLIMSWVESQPSSENSDVPKKQAEKVDVDSLKIQIGRISKVYELPLDKGYLVKEIDIGESEVRKVVSYFGSHCTTSLMTNLQNRLVVLITNVKPSKIKDIESKGLVLYASGADGIEPLGVPEDAKVGECVTFAGRVGKPEDNLNRKKIGDILPHLSIDAHGLARFNGVLFMTYGGPCTSTIHGGKVIC